MKNKAKNEHEVDLFKILTTLRHNKLILSIAVIISILSSLYYIDYIKKNKFNYLIMIPYNIKLMPSITYLTFEKGDNENLKKRNSMNKIFINEIKKNYNLKIIDSNNHFKFNTNDLIDFNEIFDEYNVIFTKKILNDELNEISFLTDEFKKLGVDITLNSDYIQSVLRSKRIVKSINNGTKVYNFKKSKIIKIPNKNIQIIIFFSILGFFIGSILIIIKGKIKVKRIISKKRFN
tara:strand:- start:34608 stop:35309 length:702 start_codon:yes stop_codon:yes gene_type:complete